jgi:Mrp family chromosome partitioning ATPase
MLHSDAFQAVPFDLPGSAPGPDQRDVVDLETIIRFWRKRRRLFLFWLATGVVASIAYAFVAPAYYTASASLLLEDNAARTAVAAVGGATDAAHSTYIETQIQVFASDEAVGRVVDAKNLTEDAEFGRRSGGLRALLVGYARALLGSEAPPPEPRYATILRVRHSLSVRRVGTSDVVELLFTSRNAARSADFANAVIQSYIDGRVALQQSERAETEAHVRQMLAELRDKAFPGAAAAASQGAPTVEEADSPTDAGSRARARFLEQQDRTETYRALYGRLLQRALGDTDAQFLSKNVRVISPATPPLIPTSRLIVVVALSVVGGVVGLGHALLREVTDDTLRSAEEVRRAHGIDQVAEVPRLRTRDLRDDKSSQGRANHEGANHWGLQPVYTAVPAAAYEAIARLAVVLHDGGNHRDGWVIGVAALTPGAGASLVGAQFARVIAETGQKVLLVDANWRKRPAGLAILSTSQGQSLASGLGSIPLGGTPPDEGSLGVLTLRATAPLSELNASLSILSTIELLRGKHDCVVVDFHACDETADLEAALAVLDQVILVAEARRTAARSLLRVARKVPGRKLAAVVLNRV